MNVEMNVNVRNCFYTSANNSIIVSMQLIWYLRRNEVPKQVVVYNMYVFET